MSVLTANNISKSFGSDQVFSGISVEISHGAKIALVGPNGAGKTTLIRILIGLEEATSGTVGKARGTRIGFLPQRPEISGDTELWDEMLTGFVELRQQEATMNEIAAQMADLKRADHDQLVERYGRLQEQFEQAGGYDYETQIKRVLQGLGFSTEDYRKPLNILSGGQKTRAFLARLLCQSPDLLVLDEPTNHLDIQAVEWLESFLNTYPGAVLVVSHDRYFMDHVASTIWELDWGVLESYRGNYSQYLTQREERHAARLDEFETQQEFIAKEEEYIRRNMAGQNTRQAQGRLKRLDRMKRDKLISRPRTASQLHISLQANTRSGDKVLVTQNLQVGYPDSPKPLLSVPDLTLFRGQVAAIIGPNGVGKSTFVKTLLNQIPAKSGDARLGAQVKIGYFAQAHELLNEKNTILDELLSVKNLPISEARDYLAQFLFTGEDVYRDVGTLSGGERGRVALAKLALGGANFLMLDEPTNHLDIPAQEVLQAVLSEFAGTILLVSHDRYLIDKLASQIWAAAPGQMTIYDGTYQEYLTARDMGKLNAAPLNGTNGTHANGKTPEKSADKTTQKSASKPDTRTTNGNGSANGQSSGSMSKFDRQKRVATLENEIGKLELALVELSGALGEASAKGQVDKVRELGQKYNDTQAAVESKMTEWENLLAMA